MCDVSATNHRTHLSPAATSRPMRGGPGSCDWPAQRLLAGSGKVDQSCVSHVGRGGVGAAARRLRSSSIHSQHDEGLTDPQLHDETER